MKPMELIHKDTKLTSCLQILTIQLSISLFRSMNIFVITKDVKHLLRGMGENTGMNYPTM